MRAIAELALVPLGGAAFLGLVGWAALHEFLERIAATETDERRGREDRHSAGR